MGVIARREPRRDRALPASVDQDHEGRARCRTIQQHRPVLVMREPEGEGGLQGPILEHDESAQTTTKGEDG